MKPDSKTPHVYEWSGFMDMCRCGMSQGNLVHISPNDVDMNPSHYVMILETRFEEQRPSRKEENCGHAVTHRGYDKPNGTEFEYCSACGKRNPWPDGYVDP